MFLALLHLLTNDLLKVYVLFIALISVITIFSTLTETPDSA